MQPTVEMIQDNNTTLVAGIVFLCENMKIAIKVKGQGHISPNLITRGFMVTQVHSIKLHQFLIRSFSVF